MRAATKRFTAVDIKSFVKAFLIGFWLSIAFQLILLVLGWVAAAAFLASVALVVLDA